MKLNDARVAFAKMPSLHAAYAYLNAALNTTSTDFQSPEEANAIFLAATREVAAWLETIIGTPPTEIVDGRSHEDVLDLPSGGDTQVP